MKSRVVLAIVGAAALLAASGVAVRLLSADRAPVFTAEYAQTAIWESGFIGTFTISNPSNRGASDWTISFDFPRDATFAGVWNGELYASKATYVIKPIASTRTVGAHRSITVGLTAVAGRPVLPRNCAINGKPCKFVATAAALAPARVGATEGFGVASPGAPGVPGPAANAPGRSGTRHATVQAAPPRTTTFAPSVNVTNPDRPSLSAIADVSGARTLTMVSALPSTGGRCDLKWGGAVEPQAYAKEIAEATNSGIALIASIGAANGLDLARACGSVAALESQVQKLLDLGVRSVDFTIGSASLADGAVNTRLAQAVVGLKARYPGLRISYSLPAAGSGGSPIRAESVTGPLVAARRAGAVIDRVNVLPVDVTAPLDVLKPLLGRVGSAGMVDDLLTAATGVHDQLMKIQGVNAATAWRSLGIIPAIGTDDLATKSSQLADLVGRLADFAQSKELGLIGLVPLNTGQACLGGVVGQLLALPAIPLLSCINPAALPGFFAIADSFNRALR
ncbi:hypothetical protein HC028_20625 [Planosporangium flavigriseum]|uniref:CBM2 domain-containing protein n=1 Tax=Planosporangium flavigriseum TaxID=373681 RepID=A0A8J3LJH9_9ACTN|nr:cellulose binding domain-containing protein [Planosporangium flavigriseum]NJC66893.1 hypothetical protein [Planosporangium flavigriseum]GIG74363.1 hypothetical protein Pfl04_27670 [Planosporangium flavigriseum]